MNATFSTRQKYQMEVAGTMAQRLRVWSLVYHYYRGKNYIPENDHELFYSVYDALPQTTSFLITRDGADLGSLTVIFDSPLGLPADEIYREELDGLRGQGRRLTEIVSLVNHANNPREGLEVLWLLYRLSTILGAMIMNYTDSVITVHPHHRVFYEKILLFQQIGVLKECPKVSNAPAVLLNLSVEMVLQGYFGAYGRRGQAFYRFVFDDEIALLENTILRQRQPLSACDFQTYFLNRPHLFKKGPPIAPVVLRQYYPELESDLSMPEIRDDFGTFDLDAIL